MEDNTPDPSITADPTEGVPHPVIRTIRADFPSELQDHEDVGQQVQEREDGRGRFLNA